MNERRRVHVTRTDDQQIRLVGSDDDGDRFEFILDADGEDDFLADLAAIARSPDRRPR